MIKKLLSKISNKLKDIDCFLIANTVKAVHEGTLDDQKKIFIGFYTEEDKQLADQILADGIMIDEDAEDLPPVIFVVYELAGDYYQCKFKRNPALCLQFPVEMLDHPKKKRIGNTYWKIPTPIEDYLECTFNEDGTYKKVEV